MSDEKKCVLIPWTGGLDSTALMVMAMKAEHRVYYVHMDGGQPETQQRAEKGACREITNRFFDLFPGRIQPKLVRTRLKIDPRETGMPMTQLPAWFMHLIALLAPRHLDRPYDEIQMGYVLGDDAAYACTHMAIAFEHLAKAIYGLDYNPPKLTFPIMGYRKGALLQLMEEHKLENLLSYCELPQLYDEGWRPCTVCVSCRRHERVKEDAKIYQDAKHLGHLLCRYDHRTKQQPAEIETSTIDELRRLAEDGPIHNLP
jgi:7-cyano-7-deazaguanine synthase in queuosine biosynthesis